MEIACGQQLVDLDVPEDRLVALQGAPRVHPIADFAAAARDALENPFEFPPLRRALTPEDKIVIAIEPNVPRIAELLSATLEHLAQAHIDPAAVTLLCLHANQDQSWIDALPDEFQEVRIETHHPDDRKLLAYLATTKGGRRIYLNRSLVDADQTVILTRRRYDALLGYAGGASVIFPGLCETETADAVRTHISLAAPNAGTWKLKHEADEVAWYLGAPFFVQVIESGGGDILHIVAGAHEARRQGERLLDAAWHVTAEGPADLVIAAIGGPGANHSFTTIAQAALNASRVLRPGGRIVLLTDVGPELGPALQIVRNTEEPRDAKQRLLAEKPPDLEAGLLWASVAEKAKIYLLSRLPIETVEELYATPLERAGQAQKLIAAAERVIVLPDAHLTLATLR